LDKEQATICMVRSRRQRNPLLAPGTVSRDANSHAGSAAEKRDWHFEEVTVDISGAPFNPRMEDADPDCFPPPKDGDPIIWIRFYCC
jgi:hypothetical protein